MLKTRQDEDLTDIVLGAISSSGQVISSDRRVGTGFQCGIATIDSFPTVPLRGSESILAMPRRVRSGNMLLLVDDLQKRVAYRQLGRYDREGRRLTPQIGLIVSTGEIK